MAKKQDKSDVLVDFEEVTGNVEGFFEKNKNLVVGVIAALLIGVSGYFAYMNLYKLPRETEAAEQMYQAQFQFDKDSFNLALNNPGGGYDGFLGIIDNYSGTNVANLAHYYAAVSYLKMGNLDEALNYIEDYSPDGAVMPVMKNGVLGDIYSEKNELDKAAEYYKKAADLAADQSDFLAAYYLLKYGELQEVLGDKKAALAAYEKIQKEYPDAPDARKIDMFIEKLK